MVVEVSLHISELREGLGRYKVVEHVLGGGVDAIFTVHKQKRETPHFELRLSVMLVAGQGVLGRIAGEECLQDGCCKLRGNEDLNKIVDAGFLVDGNGAIVV